MSTIQIRSLSKGQRKILDNFKGALEIKTDSKALARLLDYYQTAIKDVDRLTSEVEELEDKYLQLKSASHTFVAINNDWAEALDTLRKEVTHD